MVFFLSLQNRGCFITLIRIVGTFSVGIVVFFLKLVFFSLKKFLSKMVFSFQNRFVPKNFRSKTCIFSFKNVFFPYKVFYFPEQTKFGEGMYFSFKNVFFNKKCRFLFQLISSPENDFSSLIEDFFRQNFFLYFSDKKRMSFVMNDTWDIAPALN